MIILTSQYAQYLIHSLNLLIHLFHFNLILLPLSALLLLPFLSNHAHLHEQLLHKWFHFLLDFVIRYQLFEFIGVAVQQTQAQLSVDFLRTDKLAAILTGGRRLRVIPVDTDCLRVS